MPGHRSLEPAEPLQQLPGCARARPLNQDYALKPLGLASLISRRAESTDLPRKKAGTYREESNENIDTQNT